MKNPACRRGQSGCSRENAGDELEQRVADFRKAHPELSAGTLEVKRNARTVWLVVYREVGSFDLSCALYFNYGKRRQFLGTRRANTMDSADSSVEAVRAAMRG